MNISEELQIKGYYETIDGTKGAPILNRPISPRENYFRVFSKTEKPVWAPAGKDFVSIYPRIVPDNVARGFVTDARPFNADEEAGGPDAFSVEWKYIPAVKGSMVVPGKPMIEDIEDWKKIVKLPDVESWDWEGAAEMFRPVYSSDRVVQSTIFTGLFERLISFMDFEGAAIALIDDDQKPYVHELFSTLCDVYEVMMGKMKKYLKLDCITVHDDWGSQRAPFFSLAVCREMVMPYLKRLVDIAHSNGMLFNFHCCGKNEPLVPAMIEAGIDSWSGQNLNDWEALAKQYDGQIHFMIAMDKYQPDSGMTLDEFADSFIEKWEHLSRYESCIVTPPRMQSAEITDKCFRRLYTLSREKYAQN